MSQAKKQKTMTSTDTTCIDTIRVLGADKDLAPARLRVGAFFASGDSPSESSLSCPSSAQLLPMESTLGARAAAAMAAGPTRVSSRVVSRVVPTSCVSCCCCDTRVALAIALGSLPSCATMSSSWYPLLIPSLGSSLASYQDIKLLLYRWCLFYYRNVNKTQYRF